MFVVFEFSNAIFLDLFEVGATAGAAAGCVGRHWCAVRGGVCMVVCALGVD